MSIITEKQKESNRQYQKWRRQRLGIPSHDVVRKNNEISFIQKSQKVHKNKYDYSLVDYTTSTTKVQIICTDHGLFVQTPSAHRHGQGCPKCAHENRVKSRKRKTTSQFIKEANKKHNQRYDYSETKYTTIYSKIKITCPTHGVFKQTPKAHLSGQGCPTCANDRRASFFESKGERSIEEYLLENNIQYEKQKTFDDCRHKMLLRYDFYLPQFNTLIEFDGQQHYTFTPRFHGDTDGFNLMQKRDMIKTKYAHQHDISLIRIKWNEEKNIPTILETVKHKYSKPLL